MSRLLVVIAVLILPSLAPARVLPGLPAAPRQLAEQVWMFEGAREHFSRSNGGNIVNTGFIETGEGVVVIDSGPSYRYGEAQRKAIEAATGSTINRVYLTHAHPDHFLGGQAYADVPVQALPDTVAAIRRNGEALTANLYLLVGGAMSGTRAAVPQVLAVPADGVVRLGDRRLQLLALDGHTRADLAIFDETSGVLFAGDLVFFERAATTPDADLEDWLQALDQLQAIPYTTLVPGHGPPVVGDEAIAQTRDYLLWLRSSLQEAAEQGLDMNEVMRLTAPERFRRLGVLQAEWERSVTHLYPAIELESLR